MKRLDDDFFVSPQVSPADVGKAAAEGFAVIVNNRPDGEDPTAPQGELIEAAAKAAGIGYVSIPVSHAGFSLPQVDRLEQVIGEADGRVLAYCRSGTRSAYLWALAQARRGMAADEIASALTSAGYDLSPIRAMVDGFRANSE